MNEKIQESLCDKIVTPNWVEGHSGMWIFRKPKVILSKYSCGKCNKLNELVIPAEEGEYCTPCIYCRTINRMYRNSK